MYPVKVHDGNGSKADVSLTAGMGVFGPIKKRLNLNKRAETRALGRGLWSEYNRFGVSDARLRFCRSNSMNVCNDGSSIMVFNDPLESGPGARLRKSSGEDPAWLDHCRSREFRERAAAKHATCSRAREVHQEMAQAYAQMAQNKKHPK